MLPQITPEAPNTGCRLSSALWLDANWVLRPASELGRRGLFSYLKPVWCRWVQVWSGHTFSDTFCGCSEKARWALRKACLPVCHSSAGLSTVVGKYLPLLSNFHQNWLTFRIIFTTLKPNLYRRSTFPPKNIFYEIKWISLLLNIITCDM